MKMKIQNKNKLKTSKTLLRGKFIYSKKCLQ